MTALALLTGVLIAATTPALAENDFARLAFRFTYATAVAANRFTSPPPAVKAVGRASVVPGGRDASRLTGDGPASPPNPAAPRASVTIAGVTSEAGPTDPIPRLASRSPAHGQDPMALVGPVSEPA